MNTLHAWYTKGRWLFVARLTAAGAVAGVAAWALVLALHFLLGVTRPGASALLAAVPRGALVGAALSSALVLYWDRNARREGRARTRE